MENKIRILIADDHEFYLDGLKGFFIHHPIYEVIGQASNGEELVKRCMQLHPQVVLTDLKMPLMNGNVAIGILMKADPSIKCIVLTSYDNEHSIVDALEAGAIGYITKNMPKAELFEALEYVCRGLPYYCRTTTTKMIRLLSKSQFDPYIKRKQLQFSATEKKIIELICGEKNNKEIAEILCMSVRTIENNRSRIYTKMNVKTPAGVVIYAIKHALFFLDK